MRDTLKPGERFLRPHVVKILILTVDTWCKAKTRKIITKSYQENSPACFSIRTSCLQLGAHRTWQDPSNMAESNTRPALLRVKRKRDDDGADVMILESDGSAPPDAKRLASGARASVNELSSAVASASISSGEREAAPADQLTAASSAEALVANGTVSNVKPASRKRLVFRRLDTVEEGAARARDYSQQLLDQLSAGVFNSKIKPRGSGRGAEKSAAGEADALAVAMERSRAATALRTGMDRDARRSAARAAAALPIGGSVHRTISQAEESDDYMRSYFKVFDVLTGPATKSQETAASSSAPESVIAAATLVRRRAGLRPAGGADYRARFVPVTAANPGRILNPFQRMMDEAVWRAFTQGDFARVFQAMREHGMDVNFQRSQSDLTTALMAAAYHGETRIAATLIRQGALVRVPDVNGNTALSIAASRGHGTTASLLRDVLHEEEEELASWAAVQGAVPARRLGSSSASSPAAASARIDLDSNGGMAEGEDYAYDVYMLVEEEEEEADGAEAAQGAGTSTEEAGASTGRVANLRLDPSAYGSLTDALGGVGDGLDDGEVLVLDEDGSDDE